MTNWTYVILIVVIGGMILAAAKSIIKNQWHLYHQLKNKLMATLEEQLDAIIAQISKASGEITDRIDELEAELGQITPSAQQKLDALKAAAQTLDDIVPDAPPPAPEG
jgi:ABC-type transporter Mla subunit MlaD